MAQAISVEQIASLIQTLVRDGELPESLANTKIEGDTVIEDLGLDSLGYLTVIEGVSDLAGRYLPESVFEKATTIQEIAAAASSAVADS